jgi:hypothetical protein
MEGVEVLLFDVFGTVANWRGSVIAELIDLGKKYNLKESEQDWEAFAEEWRKGYLDNTSVSFS